MTLQFEWDAQKAQANQRKHQVSFEEARTIFGDPFARITEDRDHSKGELRWHILGISVQQRVLVVAYTERNETIRIITARKADSGERRRYETLCDKNR
jgi:uncharacterized DUF497 family protein